MYNLSHLNDEELKNLTHSLFEPEFRYTQLKKWIWEKAAVDFSSMTNLSKTFREKLKEVSVITDSKIIKKQVSNDGTIKYLFEFKDKVKVESVLMRFDNRSNLTACVSSQAGCAMDCKFCATGKNKFTRNLTPYEIAEQILLIERDTKLKVTNVVFMGQGEPFNNYQNLLSAIKIINENLTIGIRRMTVSTCGIVPKIYELAENDLIPTLAISLHAPNDEIRNSLMPINKTFDMAKLHEALKYFNNKTKDRVTIEYLLIKDLNSKKGHAIELANYLKDIKCNINLIPYNPIKKGDFEKPDKKDIYFFKYIMEKSGKKVTIRLERGADIDAACGQLSGK